MLSLVTNAPPPASPSTGWVTVLQPGASPGTGEMLLQATAAEPGAPGDRPSLTYSVLACGDQPFHGVLLLGGQARLDDIVVTDQRNVTSEDQVSGAPRVATVPDFTIKYDDTVWHLGSVQKIPIVIDQPTPCVKPSGDEGLVIGSGTTVAGLAQGPIQRAGNILGVNGPHTGQVWPLMGTFPPAHQRLLGLFTGLGGLQGEWSIPAVLHKRVVSGNLTARAIVDGATPALADTSKVVWDSGTPFRATVRITNIDDLDRWQSWLMAGGILLGVGASLLASLLFEWLRPVIDVRPTLRAEPGSSTLPMPQSAPTRHKHLLSSVPVSATAAVVVVSAAVISRVLRRRRG